VKNVDNNEQSDLVSFVNSSETLWICLTSADYSAKKSSGDHLMKIRTAIRAGRLDREERRQERQERRQERRQRIKNTLNAAIDQGTDWIDDFADAVLK
jgi:hypothetical protein